MLPILQIGPLVLQLPGLLIILGIWLGSHLAERSASQRQLPALKISNMIFYALIAGIIGARLGYVLRFLDLYLQSPLGILALNLNTLSSLEGGVAAVLVALIYAQRASLPLWRTLDALATGIPVVMIFVGLAHLASGDAFGAESELPWAIELWGARRHPTQVYELLGTFPIFFIVRHLEQRARFDGFVFLSTTGMMSILRFVVEAFRGDSLIMVGNLRRAQVLSLLLLVAVLIGLHLQARWAFEKERSAQEVNNGCEY
jgi:phosphatidylglycerol:prolipoprotein diacylglycerol transferase